jgi:hypothetical protein
MHCFIGNANSEANHSEPAQGGSQKQILAIPNFPFSTSNLVPFELHH